MGLEGGSVVGVLSTAHKDMVEQRRRVTAGEATQSIIDKGSYFTSLPRDYYFSQELFDAEMRRVFARQWVYAGQVSQLKAPGDYYVRDVGPESMIFTRDNAGKIRAFFNTCRHRGSRLCKDGEAGQAKLFVCPYHQWTFRNDGTLQAAPGMRDGRDFDFADFPLHEAHCDSYFGSIFVYLDEAGPKESLHDYLAPRTSDMEKMKAVQPERTKLAYRKVYDINANWKTMLENNAECYHCPVTHPTLSGALDIPGTFLNDDGSLKPVAEGNLFPFNDGMKTLSADGEWVCRKPLGIPQAEQFSTGYITFPNFCGMGYFADYGSVVLVEPVSLTHSRLICEWIVHEDAVEGVDYEIDALIAAWDRTNMEDIALAEGNYRGSRSMRYTPGPNNIRREGMIRYALTSYLEMMAA